MMEPVVRLRRADAEELPQHHLERIRLQVDQDEQQLVLGSRQDAVPTGPESAAAPARRSSGREGKRGRKPPRKPARVPGTRRALSRSSPGTFATASIKCCRSPCHYFTISEKV
jgi:hypothetical protein